MKRAFLLLLGALLLGGHPGVAAEPPVPVRTEDRPGFGRLAFDFAAPVRFRIERAGNVVAVVFTTARDIAAGGTAPRNVSALKGGAGRVEFTVPPGAELRPGRTGNRIVLDVLDPPPGAAKEAAHPEPPPPAPKAEAHAEPEAPKEGAAHPPPAPQGRSGEEAPPPEPAAAPGHGPVSLAARLAPAPEGWSLAVPFEADVGAAAFRAGESALVVFDARRPIDLAPVRSALPGASVQLLPAATVLRLPLPGDGALALQRTPGGWTITPGAGEPAAMPASVRGRTMAFGARQPGRSVTVVDRETGLTLLVGTQRSAGQAVRTGRRAPEFELLPSWQGIVVAPLADTVVLQPRTEAFVLTTEAGGLALSAPDGPDALIPAGTLTRRFDFPSVADEALAGRLRAQIAEASSVPPLARGRKRRQAATTMIALGMGAEASSLLRLAATEDAREAESVDAAALLAIASLLADRPGEAGALTDPRLDGTDEVALWRALRLAALEAGGAAPDAGADASVLSLATTARLALAYPAPLRDRILPAIAERLASGGQADAAAALLADHPDDPDLALARAMLAEARHETEAALAAYDALAAGRDRLTRVRAALRALDLRLASGTLPRKEAIATLERLTAAWRGDGRALAIRLRLAGLQAEDGQARAALATLRDAAAEYPEQEAMLRERMRAVLGDLAQGGGAAQAAPFDLVSLVGENADLMPPGEEGGAITEALADRLIDLDLPARVGPVLERLMRASPPGPARAGVGLRLARVRLDEGDAAGAGAALAASASGDVPPALAEARALVAAQAARAAGHPAEALALLAPVQTPGADAARAAIHEAAGEWPQAEQALADYAAKTVPPEGRLDEAQRRTMLRLATASVRAGDAAGLDALRQREGTRMEGGPLGDMFRLLTASPVRGTGDLGRARQDVAAARSLPEQLRSLSAQP